MPGLHARLAPSAAHRWMGCPASIELIKRLGIKDAAGYAAAEGTTFHHFVAECLEKGVEPDSFIGHSLEVEWTENGKQVKGRIEFDEQMAEHAIKGLDFIRMEAENADLYVERRVDLSRWYGEDGFGSVDVIIVDAQMNRLMVVDWKYGQGVPVKPERNPQLMIYALGVWDEFATERMKENPANATIELVILQPRCPGGGGSWECSGADLLAFGEEVREVASETREGNRFNPSPENCQFCPAADGNKCPSRTSFVLDLIEEADDGLEEPSDLPLERQAEILGNMPLIRKWLDTLAANLENLARTGHDIPGFKLVLGRKAPDRISKDAREAAEAMADTLFGELAFSRKLKTPAQLRKAGCDDEVFFDEFVERGQRKPVLVKESDPREAIVPSADLFDYE